MTMDVVYVVQLGGQDFNIRISHPKAKYQYRGYLTDASNIELGSGRWNTAEDADQALKELARSAAAVVARQRLLKGNGFPFRQGDDNDGKQNNQDETKTTIPRSA